MNYLSSLLSAGHPEVDNDESKSNKRPNPLTYPKSTKPFDDDLFENPTSEYRGCPFWAWNHKLDEAQLLRQIDNFADMGMGGFHMHVRTGLDTEYMSDEYMRIVKSCVDYAESKNMLACLYDEDRWPSGAAGGRVMKNNPEHKVKHLLFTKHKYGTVDLGGIEAPSRAEGARSENGNLLASFDIQLDLSGNLKRYKVLGPGEKGTNIWYAYLESNPGSSWFNGETYVDSLSNEAMAKFIEVTHEVYKSKVGDKFGTTVPCIFTDEPQFTTKKQLSHPLGEEDLYLPWTTDLNHTFTKEYSSDLISSIPELLWNLPDWSPSLARYRYHDHVAERFVTAFMDQLAAWCKSNNLMLDGHMMEEPGLWSQTTAIGDAMRCYRSMDMPGMDLLADRVEYNTAKQVSSVARQNGLRGAMSEIYGATHWTFGFEAHKGCGDWQAALGITFRVQHLTWVSMAGESKRDYPACIGYQSPWYKEYPFIEDHFARVAVAMTRGKALTRVAVVHPIESFWLAFGPHGSNDEQGRRDGAFAELTDWLLHGLIDFDFISESLLPNQNPRNIGKKLQVGHCTYDVVILPNLRTIRSSTLKILKSFLKAGGKVIIAGSAPDLIDGQLQKTVPTFDGATHVYWEQQIIRGALEPYREIRIVRERDPRWDRLLYQIRQDGEERYVFVCNTDRGSGAENTVQLKGDWLVKQLDTSSGRSFYLRVSHKAGWTSFPFHFDGCGSVLFRLSPTDPSQPSPQIPLPLARGPLSTIPVTLATVELSEPNVLMLDYAEFKIDNESNWSPRTEVLRLENDIRARFNFPRKGMAVAQPYSIPVCDRKPVARVTLRFTFTCSTHQQSKTGEFLLALEDASTTKIHVNDIHIPSKHSKTWWVDEAITTIPLPSNIIQKGTNTITLQFPFTILTSIERVYLLSPSLSVVRHSNDLSLTIPLNLSNLTWGDITLQNMPFYAGNVIYHCSFTITPHKANVTLSVPDFSATLLAVHDAKGKNLLGRMAFQPRTLDLGVWEKGEHQIRITAFGNRYNSFGHVHLEDGRTGDCWPDLWRTQGDWWTDEYRVKPIGVLSCPTVIVSEVSTPNTSSSENYDTASLESDESWLVIED